MSAYTAWTNARLLLLSTDRRRFQVMERGTVIAHKGRIVFAGHAHAAPNYSYIDKHDVEGRLITPGLIDPHTHLVYGGDRANEFRLRLDGATYEEIARSGGGIVSTMEATRAASEDELIESALLRLDDLLSEGVTTVEIKSGYGLRLEDELKMLRAARALEQHRHVRIKTTFLGAHALPPEFAGRSADYIDEVCNVMIPAVAAEGLADAVDCFCEGIGFSVAQTRKVFEAATSHGLKTKIHAEQLSNLRGAAIAANMGALSADHLEYLDEVGIAEMSHHGTVATLLPGAYYFTRETQLPPIGSLRRARVPMALATDCNPGTSPMTSILLAMNMGATLFRMTVDECLMGVTFNAARALGLGLETGALEVGKACDLAIWDVEAPEQLVYRIGARPLHARVFNGVPQ